MKTSSPKPKAKAKAKHDSSQAAVTLSGSCTSSTTLMVWIVTLLVLALLGGYHVGLMLADHMDTTVHTQSFRGAGRPQLSNTTISAAAEMATNRPLPVAAEVGRAPTRPLGLEQASPAPSAPEPEPVKGNLISNSAAGGSGGGNRNRNGNDVIMAEVRRLFALGKARPLDLLRELETSDVFGTANPEAFTCPEDASLRIESHPKVLFNATRSALFKEGHPDSWIFYQHLRKAGGTGFCELARSNMERKTVPPYFCMPDNRGSLATAPWNKKAYVLSQLQQRGHRMASNEWDSYQDFMGTWDNAVFATTFRDPVDRWYSQYKFEYLEHRDGSDPKAPRPITMLKWYKANNAWMMTSNYYIKTFMGTVDTGVPHGKGDFYWTYHKFKDHSITEKDFIKALSNLQKFNLILVLEWLDLDLTKSVLDKVLGWTAPPKKVRPHAQQAPNRDSGQVGMAIRSSTSKRVLPADEYQYIAIDNVLDILFYHIAQRLLLERLVCGIH